MWTMPLNTFLDIDIVEPHENYLKEDKLKQHDPKKDFVIFISHQWLSEFSPDPNGTQLQILQDALRNLFKKSQDTVHEESCNCARGIQLDAGKFMPDRTC